MLMHGQGDWLRDARPANIETCLEISAATAEAAIFDNQSKWLP